MNRWQIPRGFLVALALIIVLSMGPARAQVAPQSQGMQPEQVGPIQDLYELLNYPYAVDIKELVDPEERAEMVRELMAREEAIQLRMRMAEKGFIADLAHAEAMQVILQGRDPARTLDVVVVRLVAGQRVFLPLILKSYSSSATLLTATEPSSEAAVALEPEDLSAYLVAMVADDGTSFFQAHHTNLDPSLAEVPDPPIIVNGMPYFYITTLQVVNRRIVHWHYWWFDSHHHPNWYYAYYQHYWNFHYHFGLLWPPWHHWAYGWYYWRFWYYWSTYFPWVVPIVE